MAAQVDGVDYEAAQNYPKDASVTAVLDTIKAENETVLNRVIGTSSEK